jgi:phosphoenolpyruvate-protein kinase (PTS system EI component)
MFETQVRAIVTAAQEHHDVRILLPMVLGAGDLADAIELISRLSLERGSASPKIGAMIETPAALFALDEILELAEFVCIGTNDLTQFMLAADRDASELADDYSVLHPSVLRAIAKVVQAARSADREVCVCGEAASYPRTAGLLVGLGARELSMSPVRAARVRYLLRESSLEKLEQLADSALASKSAAAVRQLLTDLPSDLAAASLSAGNSD